MSSDLSIDEIRELRAKLEELKLEHRDLDDVIGQMSDLPFADQIQIKRLKKRKLMLKDRIELIKSRLLPDILA